MRTNDAPVTLRPSDIDRFWSYVTKSDGCWLWNGTRQQKGYGTLMVPGRRRCTTHRLSWLIHHGPIPATRWVLHRCDVPACVNPDHLFLGDHRMNMADAKSKGRTNRQHLAALYRGENSGKAKVTEAIVRTIRALAGHLSRQKIAVQFGVTKSAVAHIIARRVWQHVT